MAWSEAGPAFAHDLPEHYAHDGAFSMVWQMRDAPPGVFYDHSLKSLLAPHPDIARKRVTVIYRPQSAETARRMVERDVRDVRDVRDARTQASARTRPQAHDTTMLAAAEKAAPSPMRRCWRGRRRRSCGCASPATTRPRPSPPGCRWGWCCRRTWRCPSGRGTR